MTAFKKIICVDFDGVIHWYRKGWQGGEIYDDPVPGAIEWLIMLSSDNDFEVAIYSSRSKDSLQLDAMKIWLRSRISEILLKAYSNMNLMEERVERQMSKLSFPTQKPAAWLTIDDRAICFKGEFPTVFDLHNFKPWNK